MCSYKATALFDAKKLYISVAGSDVPRAGTV